MKKEWIFKNNDNKNKDRILLDKMMKDFEITEEDSNPIYMVERIHEREYNSYNFSDYDIISAEIYSDKHIEYFIEESNGIPYSYNPINIKSLDELRKFCELFVKFVDMDC